MDENTCAPSKRPRGRPPGSKNKPKNPIPVGEEVDKTTQLIHIDAGSDVVESLLNLAQHHNVNITVLSGSGLVSEVTLFNHVSRAPAVPMEGTFDIFLLEGTYFNPNCGPFPPQLITDPPCSSFNIQLSTPEGNVFCGNIGGKVMAASQVTVTANLFKKPIVYEIEPINKNIEKAEQGDERYVAGVISNQDHEAPRLV